MRSRWIEHNGLRILYGDFANLFHNSDALKQEIAEVQQVILNEPNNSVLVISDFTNTEIGGSASRELRAFNKATEDHVRKTAVLGVGAAERLLGDTWSRITGAQLMYFSNEAKAKAWLVQ